MLLHERVERAPHDGDPLVRRVAHAHPWSDDVDTVVEFDTEFRRPVVECRLLDVEDPALTGGARKQVLRTLKDEVPPEVRQTQEIQGSPPHPGCPSSMPRVR